MYEGHLPLLFGIHVSKLNGTEVVTGETSSLLTITNVKNGIYPSLQEQCDNRSPTQSSMDLLQVPDAPPSPTSPHLTPYCGGLSQEHALSLSRTS